MTMPDGSTHDCLWQNRKPHIDNCVSYERYTLNDTSVLTFLKGAQITATKPEPQSLEHPELTRIRAERAAAYSKTDAADSRAKDGFVYLIRIPGQVAVKVGHARDPMQRIKSVKSFLVEDPEVVHMVYTNDRYADEQAVHKQLDKYRHHSGKELFYVGTEYAMEVMNEHVGIRHRGGRVAPGADDNLAADDSGGER